MSDILIKNMEIPKDSKYVDVRIFRDGTATTSTAEEPFYKKMDVVEVPTPHGRLIDADALKEQWLNAEKTIGAEKVLNLPLECFISYGCVYDLDNAPTIIEEAETGG